jgi:hypothetical protein
MLLVCYATLRNPKSIPATLLGIHLGFIGILKTAKEKRPWSVAEMIGGFDWNALGTPLIQLK